MVTSTYLIMYPKILEELGYVDSPVLHIPCLVTEVYLSQRDITSMWLINVIITMNEPVEEQILPAKIFILNRNELIFYRT